MPVIDNVRPTDAGQVDNQASPRTVQDIVGEATNQPSEKERAREARLEELDRLRVSTTTEVEPEECALRVDGVGIFALRDLHAIKGKQKSGKSSVLKVLLAALLGGSQFRVQRAVQEPVVLFLDTEQKAEDVKLVIEQLKQMTGCTDEYADSHLFLYALRRLGYDTLLRDTRLLVEHHRPQVVFIDGVVDYVASFNDEELSRRLVQQLLVLCDEFDCAIVCALHENKALDDDNMRGHLGTVLSQKAANILRCQKTKKGIITVSCPDSRHETMPQWSIAYDQEGRIVEADAMCRKMQEQQTMSRIEKNLERSRQVAQQRVEAIRQILREAGGYATRKEVKRRLMERLNLSESTVQKFIKDCIGKCINETNGYLRMTEDSDLFV